MIWKPRSPGVCREIGSRISAEPAGEKKIPEGWPGGLAPDDPTPGHIQDLLKQANYKGDAIPFRLLNNYYTNQTANGQIMAEMWKQVGLNVEIEMKENWGQIHDPAGVKGAKTAAEALAKIAEKQAPFVSRGDESGTHQKERELWQVAGGVPKAAWYVEAGQGMGEVIVMATEKQGYTLADRGTYNAFKKAKTNLVIVFDGEKGLFNPYGVIAVNPQKHPHVKYDLALKFIDYITGPEGQKIIADYQVDGDPIFFVYK